MKGCSVTSAVCSISPVISSFDGSSIYFGWKSTRVKSLSEMESCLSIDGNMVDVTRPAARVSRQMGKSLVERGKHYHFVSLPLIRGMYVHVPQTYFLLIHVFPRC